MNLEAYVYKEALTDVNNYINKAVERHPNNPLAVLNDVVVFMSRELSDVNEYLKDTQISNNESLDELSKVLNEMFSNQVEFTIIKGGR